jgi:ribose-phosphate pyrophosphokinase
MADLSIAAGIERLITLQPHAAQIHGFYGTTPVTVLEMVPLFVERYHDFQHRNDVIVVAPDAGAAKWVQQFCQMLGLPVALAAKFRPRPEEAAFSAILGDFSGKRVALILDDIISSGGTIYELARKLIEEKGIKEVYLGVAHNLCSRAAILRLSELQADGYLQEVFVTNSIPQTAEFSAQPFVTIHDLSDTLCQLIGRIHHNQL